MCFFIKECSLFAIGYVATRISQRTGVGTPRRSVKRQEAVQTEWEAVDEVIQQSGVEGKPREVSDFESEADVVSDAEMEPEAGDVSEAEMDSDDNGELTYLVGVVRWGG